MRLSKTNAFSFISPLSRHTVRSFGYDIGLKEFMKRAKVPSASGLDKFSAANDVFTKVGTAVKAISLINKLHIGLVSNGHASATNGDSSRVPYSSEAESSSLGRNDATYHKVHAHIGKPSKHRIKEIQSSAFIETVSRLTASSSRDYLSHPNREQLNFRCGFNQKGFSFLMEDTYFSVSDYYDLFKVKKKYQKELESSTDGKKDIYACILNTKHKFKLKNRLDYYTVHIKIHLIKIMDITTDVRTLIKEITHNSANKSFSKLDKAGKIPIDQQYSDPNLTDFKNKLSINFKTALNCNLNLSTRFRERAKIIKTWTRTLPAGSIWEFNLTHHLGGGIHLNRIYDLQNTKIQNKDSEKLEFVLNSLNQTGNRTTAKTVKENLSNVLNPPLKKSEHPVGYIFCIEHVGDRRASIINENNDYFSGYSPCHFSMEFDTEIKCLTNQENEDDFLVYKESRQEKNFGEDSEFSDIFYPNREAAFHVDFNNINITGGEKNTKYKLVYDQSIKSTGDYSNIFNLFGQKLSEYGINLDSLSQDEVGLNVTKSPSDVEDYEGTGGPPPNESESES